MMVENLKNKIVASNRKAKFDYYLEDSLEVGIILEGSEVKSLREGKANIADAYASIDNGELFLLNLYIPEYGLANKFNHQTRKPRKLLLHKKELKKFIGKLKKPGLTLVALSIYFNKYNKAKVEIALGKGKKEYDKRATEKDRQWQRDKARILRND